MLGRVLAGAGAGAGSHRVKGVVRSLETLYTIAVSSLKWYSLDGNIVLRVTTLISFMYFFWVQSSISFLVLVFLFLRQVFFFF